MRMRFKPWAEPYIEANKQFIISHFNEIKEPFTTLRIEIGAGKGDFLVESAIFYPNDLFIGIELSKMAAAMALQKIVEKGLTNVYLFIGDAEDFFLTCPKDVCHYLYLNFPDPWPKARHEKRRLTFHKKLSAYYETLKVNGELLFKSDNELLYIYTLETFQTSKFAIISHGQHFLKSADDPQSAYERKFRDLKQTIYFLQARRN